jgi:hypothetical protein
MVCAYRMQEDPAGYEPCLFSLRLWQEIAMNGDQKGIAATFPDSLRTGIFNPDGSNWCYYDRLHLGATAWYIFAENQENYNPFWLNTQPIPVTEMQANVFQVFPNPAKSKLTLRILLSSPAILDLHIFDLGGIEVKSCMIDYIPPNEQTFEIGIDSLSPGIYLLKVMMYGRTLGIEKIIIL